MAIQHTLSEQQRVLHYAAGYCTQSKRQDNPYLAYHAYANDFVYPYSTAYYWCFKANDTLYAIWRWWRYLNKDLCTVVAIAPIKDIFRSTDTDDHGLTIDNADDAAPADTPIDDDLVLEDSQSAPEDADEAALFDTIDFKNERTVVTDIRIINKIEIKKKRRLLNLWRIAKFGDDGQVFVAMFRPNGKDHLGTIVVKQKERFMFSDYAAVFSMDGESIWRINDGGTFSAASFVLDDVKKSAEGQLNFS